MKKVLLILILAFNSCQKEDRVSNANQVWERIGTVLTASIPADQNNVFEPTVIIEGNPKILTAAKVFKMWYSSGWDDPNINYAESLTGLPGTWVKYSSNPIVKQHCRNFVLKDNGTYIMYASLNESGDQIDRYTSLNGVNWSMINAGVIKKGKQGAWNAFGVHNSHVFIENGTWNMFIDGRAASTYSIGYYTSNDGINWTEYNKNPVIKSGMGGANIIKSKSTYWLYCHGPTSSPGLLPSDIFSYQSVDLINWSASDDKPMFKRSTPDEGEGTKVGQVADAFVVPVGNKTYLYYSAASDGSSSSGKQHIKLAIAEP